MFGTNLTDVMQPNDILQLLENVVQLRDAATPTVPCVWPRLSLVWYVAAI